MTRRFILAILMLVVVGLALLPAAAVQFTNVGTTLGLTNTSSAAWGDYDADGYADLYIGPTYTDHGPQLLHNNHNGTFTDVTVAMGISTTKTDRGGGYWADYDNDGYLDLLTVDWDQQPKLYHNNGSTFTEVGAASGLTGNRARAATWFDYDRDNWLDVFICNEQSLGHLFHNNQNGTFTEVTAAAGLGSPGGWLDTDATIAECSAAADVNNDGWPDLIMARYWWGSGDTAHTRVYVNNHDGTFTNIAVSAGVDTISANGRGVGVADYNRDGHLDFNITRGQASAGNLFRNNGAGTFTDRWADLGTSETIMAYGTVWMDYDNDGWDDLYIANETWYPFLFHNQTDGTFTDVAQTQGMANQIHRQAACSADYDRDGKLDLFVGARDAGINSNLYHNTGTVGNWLRVVPLTNANGNAGDPNTTISRVAIGARVEVNLDNDTQFSPARTIVRVIDGGSSFRSQNEQVAHFGLGGTTLVAVRVLFPNGDISVLNNVTANQQITVGDLPPSFGTVTGSILSIVGIPIPGVAVNCGPYTSITGLDGTFTIPDVIAGMPYTLTTNIPGYLPATITNVSVTADGTTTLEPIVLEVIPSTATQRFADIGATLGIPSANGAAWGDYNDDGYPDLYLGGVWQSHGPTLLHNNGDGAFSDITDLMGLTLAYCEDDGVAWGDYNNDGRLDLLVSQGNAPLRLYRNDVTTFTDVAAAAGLTMPNGGRGVAWGDYDRDGWLDVAVCDYYRAVHLYHNNQDGTFTDVATAAGMGIGVTSMGSTCAWADINGDGWIDLVVVEGDTNWSPSTGVVLLLNNQNGTFTDATTTVGLTPVDNPSGLAIADYDNDGLLDIYITTFTARPNYLFHNNGDGTFTDLGQPLDMPYENNLGCAWADYDNDCFVDLFVARHGLGWPHMPFLMHNNGNGTFTDVAGSEGLSEQVHNVAIWADINLDGKMDLFSGTDGPSVLYRNTGDAGNWLRVVPLTNADGNAADPNAPVTRTAIGARVEVNLDNNPQFPQDSTLTRLVDGGSSYLGQNEPVAQFGLGTANLVAVRVLFPSGDLEVLTDVTANQEIPIGDLPPGFGTITGTVVDQEAAPLAGVSVTCGLYSAVTDPNGAFTIPGVSAHTSYTFTFSKTGYWPITVAGVSVAASETTTLDPVTLTLIIPPTINISSPSSPTATTGPVSYTVTYTHATAVTLARANITLNKTGTANGTVSVTGSGTASRTVTISSITGNGTLGISIAAGTASNSAGSALAAGPSETFAVTNPIYYHLTVAASPTSGGSVTGSGDFLKDTVKPVTATANAGWRFSGWTGSVADPNASSTTVTMTSNKTVTAYFVQQFTLTTAASPLAGGSVSGGGTYDSGLIVTVEATPVPGYAFTGWSGALTGTTNPTTVTMSANKSVTANFARITYTVAATASPTAGGTVTGGGSYYWGDTATLTATPASGYWFTGWSGDLTGLTNPADITIDGNKSVTATFTHTPIVPTGVTATALSSTQIRLDWSFTGTVSGFRIYRKVAAGAWGTTPIATVGNTVRTYTNSALSASMPYTYRICAYNSYGNSPYSGEAAATTFIYIAAPTTLAAKAAASSQVNLNWLDKSTNETGFCVERRLGTTGNWEEITTTAAGATSYADTSCTPSTLYNYRVCAKVDEASSAYSNTASVTTPVFVAPPSDLTATALAYNQIGLTWSFTGTTAGFKIYRRTGTGAWGTTPVATLGATVRSYTNSGLTASTSYTYRVCAYSGTASSAASNEASATTMIFVATPTTLVAKAASATQVNLTWVDKSTNETGFSIERRLGTTGVWAEIGTVGAGIKAYSDTSVDPNTSYGYRVRAIADDAVSAYSNIVSVKTPIYVAAPTDLVATSASATSIGLTWTDNADNESGYKIERRLSTVTTWTVVATTLANVTSYTNTGLTTGRTYIYRVRAYKSTTYSSYSDEATVTAGG
jgi:uncharacterized repeat protein (TIGR02543 family)